jgi:hypothetical protein
MNKGSSRAGGLILSRENVTTITAHEVDDVTNLNLRTSSIYCELRHLRDEVEAADISCIAPVALLAVLAA